MKKNFLFLIHYPYIPKNTAWSYGTFTNNPHLRHYEDVDCIMGLNSFSVATLWVLSGVFFDPTAGVDEGFDPWCHFVGEATLGGIVSALPWEDGSL